MKRFRVFNELRSRVYDHDSTDGIYEWLQRQDMGLNSYMIDCCIDDIEVSDIDFMEAFDEGERPGDLTFF